VRHRVDSVDGSVGGVRHPDRAGGGYHRRRRRADRDVCDESVRLGVDEADGVARRDLDRRAVASLAEGEDRNCHRGCNHAGQRR